MSQGVRPTPSPSVVFFFGLSVESIKELGGASTKIFFIKHLFSQMNGH
jgi:hypothetical protein